MTYYKRLNNGSGPVVTMTHGSSADKMARPDMSGIKPEGFAGQLRTGFRTDLTRSEGIERDLTWLNRAVVT